MRKLFSSLLLVTAIATIQQVQAADYSVGVKAGSPGVGVSFSLKNTLKIRREDQVQTRFEISRYTTDPVEGRTYAETEYEGNV